ncbi:MULTISPECIES: UvrD-helicase domain-containing protein [unclassified Simplicispira]|uniref:UvrD-helicase domain-containing protein n=1 Tax=unclassified Simplicispira TaxID=2630407 RepID=UPI000D5F6ED5|nr:MULTISPECIES: UvrD-helicase domain-containing protein [unclassified Simplicispira]PVY56512.1 DNA helicase-2/ATP-dependent DNA helicase PcrA [Simplicispira sp. 125]REG17457.1 DNA helicase-2/ATP-dependent DNA helicase PcrA [Simplicispira sp. 110]
MFPQDPISGAPSAASPLLAHLNPEQLAAVTLPAGHALILAGAGSGKTRVLTTRIAWLLNNGYATPGGILAVTFTNKAAKEMVARLSAMLPINVRGMWIGTFHGLCNRLLRAHHQAAGLPQSFQILDTQDQLSAVKRLCKQFNMDDECFPPKQLQYFIAGCKEEGMRPGDVPVAAHDVDGRKKVEFYQLYEEQCQREGVVDFGELMLRSYELLRDNDPIRVHYQRRFAHILVDEFQDTNKLQYAWLKQLAGDEVNGRFEARGSVIAVGDDDQSIYAFRGARVGNMADFVREFDVQRQIKLEQNYRSYSNILDAANQLISHNTGRLGKNLRTEQGPGEPVRVYEAPSDLMEARWMVEEIRNLVKSDGFSRQEIAVLYRSNAQSRIIESTLFNAAVPYRVYGGLRFFERAEVKSALAYLRLLENPQDDTSFMRVVNFPPRGIGARSVEILQDAARSAGCSLHDAVSAVPGKAGANLGAFVAMVDVLREQTQGLNLRSILEQMLKSTGLVEHYRAEKEGADRVENLEELVNAAESFVTQEGFGRDAVALPLDEHGLPLTQSPASQGLDPDAPLLDVPLPGAVPDMVDIDTGETLSPLAAFLTHAALEAGDNQAQAGQEAVQLMTVHASKGLEFDAVFIGGMEEGLFPHENAISDKGGLEEERRLMYVAITRARKRLYLSHSQTRMLHGQTRYNPRSRFFEELPESALKWITPKQQGFGSFAPHSGAGSAYPSSARGSFGFKSETFASPPVPVQKAAPAHGLRAGMAVFHNKFGEGKVLAIEGTGDDARAQVSFPRHGTKWLALSVAKLTVVE